MNITFLIGNGFDLNLNLATQYRSFLTEYTKTAPSDTADIKKFKEDILQDFDSWANAEKAFGAYTSEYNPTLFGGRVFCDCHEDFCIHLAQYLHQQESRIDFANQTDSIARAFARSIAFESIVSAFREAQREQITKAYDLCGGGEYYSFIDFNYTTVLDQYIDAVQMHDGILGNRAHSNASYKNKITKLIHVHGYTDQDMVLGVNDESQIACLDIFQNIGEEYLNQIIKIKTNEMNEQNTDSKAHAVISQSDLIYIYGMSLGETDTLWWKRIIKTMIEKPHLHVIIHCFDAPKDGLIMRKLRTYEKEKRNEFLAFSDIDATKRSTLESRIHIDRSNIFERLANETVVSELASVATL